MTEKPADPAGGSGGEVVEMRLITDQRVLLGAKSNEGNIFFFNFFAIPNAEDHFTPFRVVRGV